MPPAGFEPASRAREARILNRSRLQGHNGPDRIRTGVWWSEATQDIQATSQARIKTTKIHLKRFTLSKYSLRSYPIWCSRESNRISNVIFTS